MKISPAWSLWWASMTLSYPGSSCYTSGYALLLPVTRPRASRGASFPVYFSTEFDIFTGNVTMHFHSPSLAPRLLVLIVNSSLNTISLSLTEFGVLEKCTGQESQRHIPFSSKVPLTSQELKFVICFALSKIFWAFDNVFVCFIKFLCVCMFVCERHSATSHAVITGSFIF